MRNLIIAIALLLSVNTYCQNNVAVQVSQDMKLALASDDYGNDPFTLDVTGKIGYHIHSEGYDYMQLYGQHERAELAGGLYTRSAFGVGYGFRVWKLEFVPSLNVGFINRKGESYDSMELQGELHFIVSKHFNVFVLGTYTDRTDIGIWRANSSIGIKYHLFRTD